MVCSEQVTTTTTTTTVNHHPILIQLFLKRCVKLCLAKQFYFGNQILSVKGIVMANIKIRL
jgi:hypothetical protein